MATFKVFCEDCGVEYEQSGLDRVTCCGACGSRDIRAHDKDAVEEWEANGHLAWNAISRAVSEKLFRPFNKTDWASFAGTEGEHPHIAEVVAAYEHGDGYIICPELGFWSVIVNGAEGGVNVIAPDGTEWALQQVVDKQETRYYKKVGS